MNENKTYLKLPNGSIILLSVITAMVIIDTPKTTPPSPLKTVLKISYDSDYAMMYFDSPDQALTEIREWEEYLNTPVEN